MTPRASRQDPRPRRASTPARRASVPLLLTALVACSADPDPSPSPALTPTPAITVTVAPTPAPQPKTLGELLRREHRRLHQAADSEGPVFNLMTASEHEAHPITPALADAVAALPTWTAVMARLGEALAMDVLIEESHLLAILVPHRRYRAALQQVSLLEAAHLLGEATGKPARVDPAVPPVDVSLDQAGRPTDLFAALLAQAGPADVFTLEDTVRALWLTTAPPPADRQWSPPLPDPDRTLVKTEVLQSTADTVQLEGFDQPITLAAPAPPTKAWGAFRLIRDAGQTEWRLTDWVVRLEE